MCRFPHPHDVQRDSGGWIDSRTVYKDCPPWIRRDYGHCFNELLLRLVCCADDKGGRFQVAMPITEVAVSLDGSTSTHIWVDHDMPCADRWQKVENFRMSEVSSVWYIRTTQGQLRPKTYLMDRLFNRMDTTSMTWCHSLTHMTSVDALQGILKWNPAD